MKSTANPIIIGAGLAGLLAAHAWPQLRIAEAATAPRPEHRALLRFRTDSVAKLTGIEFRKVRVRKGIFWRGDFHPPSIEIANLYSRKCLGSLEADRSIWNIEPADRFIAPEDFYEQLMDAVQDRIDWDAGMLLSSPIDQRPPLISTAPLPAVVKALGLEQHCPMTFTRAAINVERFRVPDCDVYQTVYYPGDETTVYRASITKDILIIESRGDRVIDLDEMNMVLCSFGLDPTSGIIVGGIDRVSQRYGKIAQVDDWQRKQLILRLSTEFNIYSLGRFATWRNILLDDVVDDIAVIKRLMRVGPYDHVRSMT